MSLLYLKILLLLYIYGVFESSGAGLQRTNVVLITDVDRGNFPYSKYLVKSILDRISLLRYRVSFFTTNGIKQTLMNFQSRQCTVAKMRENYKRRYRLTDIVKYALRDALYTFFNDTNVVVILTDKKRKPWLINLLNKIASTKKLQNVYANEIPFTPVRNNQIRRFHPNAGYHSDKRNSFYSYYELRNERKYDENNSQYFDGTSIRDHDYSNKRYYHPLNDLKTTLRKDQLQKRSENGNATESNLVKNIKILALKNVTAFLQQLDFLNERTCSGNGTIRDECNRKCRCVDGKFTDCFRVRQEFSSMTKAERLRYMDIYKHFSSEKRFTKLYSRYVMKHTNYFWKGVHTFPQFLPWHRRYILGFENYLRAFDCRVTVPYWNWALHEKEAWKVTSQHLTWNNETGLGGNGHENQCYCVLDGPFSHDKWKPPTGEDLNELIEGICENNNDDIKDGSSFASKLLYERCKTRKMLEKCYSKKRCLRRRFSGYLPSYKQLYKTIWHTGWKNIKDFESTLREYWHGDVHNRVGGDMSTDYSSHSPEFWMHHGMLDCAWEKWQQKGHAYKYAHFRDKHTKLMAFKTPQYRYKFVQNDNLDNCGVKVTCEDILPKKVHFGKHYG